jgi:hypothetical protein
MFALSASVAGLYKRLLAWMGNNIQKEEKRFPSSARASDIRHPVRKLGVVHRRFGANLLCLGGSRLVEQQSSVSG